MTQDFAHYGVMSRLFEPPGPGFTEDAARIADALRGSYPEAAAALDRFGALLPEDADALAELYLRTFDIQAITTLDLGYTLFGEDYKRGALLAGLANEHKQARNDCGIELGDHLSNVLRLLPLMAEPAVREELVSVIVAPAVREMIREFEPARIAKKEEIYKKHHKTIIEHAESELRTAYRRPLEALHEVLRKDFSLKVSLPIEQAGSYERSLETEMGIEGCGPCAPSA